MVANKAVWVRQAWDKGYKTHPADQFDDVTIGVDGDKVVITRSGSGDRLVFSREDWRKIVRVVNGELGSTLRGGK